MTTDAYDHAAVCELLGAWAVHALPPSEQHAIPRHLADCADCAAEAERLRETVRLLDGPDAPTAAAEPGTAARNEPNPMVMSEPTPATRNAALARILAVRPPAPRTAPHAEPYAAAVAALRALLAELDPQPDGGPDLAAWRTPVIHDWTVQDTVAHLIAADEHLAAHLGLPANHPQDPQGAAAPGDTDWRTAWDTRTHRVIAHERTRPPTATVATWRAQASALLACPAANDPELAARAATLVGVRLPVAEHFLIRAFETWIHADDIGRALGRPVPPPPAAHLWRLVRLAVRILGLALGPTAEPVALTVTDAARSTEWILGAEGEPVRAELVLDPVDFCLLMGGRLAPEAVPRAALGDEAAVRTVLGRAARLAWL
ncbi:maleylpyruvate isomerase family mycothiol-dependent enzyme [Streptomyces kunmingensis]|uniref:Maleylpyruvate isomerase family mycothiol-dependent enzyme n=1 Tax=Streptomyces kunmingensis TaxID=68225 RepID=A0ABU6C7S2_9ACTN|nr:maleylpyruvate isomerase family mycothiol-dependent enzyme [Streptomyces kunmingensis]MEB3960761.1 maleylpyruvate isomerase family mycothiol-dependent enzyme [Streptomyces kunmingensis]